MSERPKGALRKTPIVVAPFYLVWAPGKPMMGDLLEKYDESSILHPDWFNGKAGYCFHNYFLAYAYSLKWMPPKE